MRDEVAIWVTFVDECEAVVLDGLYDGGSDCDNAGEGFRIFWGSARVLRYSAGKDDQKSLTRLNIAPFVSLSFLLFLLELVRYSKIGVLGLRHKGGYVVDSRWSRVE